MMTRIRNCVVLALLTLTIVGDVKEATGQLCKPMGGYCAENPQARVSCSATNRMCGWIGSACRCKTKLVVGQPAPSIEEDRKTN